MSVLLENEDYLVTYELVEGSELGLLAFTGVGHGVGAIQIEEFRKTASDRASVVFIRDLKRSWWNNGSIETVLQEIITFLKAQGAVRIHAIGNSMGGSGALLAAHLCPDVQKVYAFVPQADPYADSRWNEYTDHISEIRWPNFAALEFAADTTIFFGTTGLDQWQIKLFQEQGHNLNLTQGGTHDVAAELKQTGAYEQIMERFW